MLGVLGVGGCALCEALLRCLHAHACISFHQRGQDFSLEASLEEARSRTESKIGVVMCGIVSDSVKMFKELFTKDTIGVESKGTKGRLFPFRELGIFGSLAVLGLNKKLCWIVGVAKMGARIRLEDGDICEGDPVVEVLCAIRPCSRRTRVVVFVNGWYADRYCLPGCDVRDPIVPLIGECPLECKAGREVGRVRVGMTA